MQEGGEEAGPARTGIVEARMAPVAEQVPPVGAVRQDRPRRAGPILELESIPVSEQGLPTEEVYRERSQAPAILTAGKRAVAAHQAPAAEWKTYYQVLQKRPARALRRAHQARISSLLLFLFRDATAQWR